MSETAEQDEHLSEGSLLSHLVELRNRLIKMVAAVIVLFAVLIPFNQTIFGIVSAPLLAAVPGGEMIAIGTISNVLVPFKLTFFVSLMLAMPVILYQVWAFVAPGLYRKEKRFAFPLLASSVALFYVGALFAYYVVFPLIFGFLASIEIDGAPWVPDIASYLDTITSIVLAFGLAFEVPIATLLLVWTGITTPKTLGKARPYVFLGAFVVGMLLTPPDVISQTLLAVPVYLLFEAGIVMSRMFGKKETESAEPSAE